MVLLAIAMVAIVFTLAREYVRRPRRTIATDHEHAHHTLIWVLLVLLLLGVCGPGGRQGPQGPPGPPGPGGPPGPSGKPAGWRGPAPQPSAPIGAPLSARAREA